MKFALILLSLISSFTCQTFSQWFKQTTPFDTVPGGQDKFDARDVQFLDTDTGYIVGTNTVLKTTDSGTNWKLLEGFEKDNLYGLQFLNSRLGWVIGDGVIKKTINGGNTWVKEDSLGYLRSIHFINDSIGWLSSHFGAIYKTTDGGMNWNKLYQVHFSNPIHKIYFHNQDLGWFVGKGDFGGLFQTTDGGSTWESIYSSDGAIDFQFLDDSTGFVLEVIGHISTVSKTTDGGKRWPERMLVPIEFFQLETIFFLNENVGYAGGETDKITPGIYKTTDGGRNWVSSGTDESYSTIRAYYFVNENVGWAVGDYSSVFRTVNLGVNAEESTHLSFYSRLSQNYPNPFNPVTTIEYQIASASHVTLQVYSLLGEEVAVLVNQEQNPGQYSVAFDASNLPSGVYFYKLVAGSFSESKRMILLK